MEMSTLNSATRSDQAGRTTKQKVTYILAAPLPLLAPFVDIKIAQTLAIFLHGERFMLSMQTSPAYRGILVGKRRPVLWSS